MHNQTFAFESDFVNTLRCVPMAVRMKLDIARIKLTLRQWSRLSREDRQQLLDTPCETESDIGSYRAVVKSMVSRQNEGPVRDLAQDEIPQWPEPSRPPPQVQDFAGKQGIVPISAPAWQTLTDLQRFALVKLSRDNHDNVNFLPALEEFGLIG
jgi:hypothetical protein